jgi:hypothetical protein
MRKTFLVILALEVALWAKATVVIHKVLTGPWCTSTYRAVRNVTTGMLSIVSLWAEATVAIA